jgi:hypothetical protein
MGNASRGSKNDREVAERFVAKPKAMCELAGSIRASVAAGEPLHPGQDLRRARLHRR